MAARERPVGSDRSARGRSGVDVPGHRCRYMAQGYFGVFVTIPAGPFRQARNLVDRSCHEQAGFDDARGGPDRTRGEDGGTFEMTDSGAEVGAGSAPRSAR